MNDAASMKISAHEWPLPSADAEAKAAVFELEVPDIVSICKKEDRAIFARGLINYSSEEIEKIKGCSTSHIAKVLGYKLYDEVIHRDNMVIL